MSNITRTFSTIILACSAASILFSSISAANEKPFSYPHRDAATTFKLMDTPNLGFDTPQLIPNSDRSTHKSEKNNFSISTSSAHRALFRPGSSTSIQSDAPELGAAYTAEQPGSKVQTSNIWLNDNELSKPARDLINYIARMDQHGLNSGRYNHNDLQAMLDKEITEDDRDRVSSSLHRAFKKVANAIGGGIIDPTVSQQEWDREAVSIDTDTLLVQISRGLMDVDTAFSSIEPKDPRYQGLKDMLQALYKLDLSDQIFVEAGKDLQPGGEDESVQQLKNALIATGDLKQKNASSRIYDTDLEMAVQRFQLRHGLETNGLVDKKTLQHLNTPIADRIAQVRANLERWRWFPSELEESHIMVNIPEYRVRMIHSKDALFEMDVVVGKPKHMTPVFSETMKQVVFAPTWTVPASITNDELIPIEKRSPGYFEREEIDFFRHTSSGLKRVPRSAVTRETLDQKPFPYMLRQRAGNKNVLGKVKFLFPNKHAVYMHDTQAKKLFEKPQRAFSHGCIRLSNPDLMAYVIMQLDGYEQSEVNDYMALTSTTNVHLNTPIPVHIAYFTAWQDEYGMMHFREDIYKQDQRLIQALDAKQGKIDRLAAATR